MRAAAPSGMIATLTTLTLLGSACISHAGEPEVGNEGASPEDSSTTGDVEIARVLALSDDPAWGEYLAGECATCHGATSAESAVPDIHGMNANHIVRAMFEYRSSVRSNTTMQSVAGALSDEEVAVIAHYLAAREP